MALSLARGKRVSLSKVDAFADGVAVKSVRHPAIMLVARAEMSTGNYKFCPDQSELHSWHLEQCLLTCPQASHFTLCQPSGLIVRAISRSGHTALLRSLQYLSADCGPKFSSLALVCQVGTETFRLCRELLDGILLVDNRAISGAIEAVFNDKRSILEPAGAVAVAGATQYLERQGLKVHFSPGLWHTQKTLQHDMRLSDRISTS